jgi:glycine dehydrogenase
MLDTIGMASLDEMLDTAVPESIRSSEPLELQPAVSEAEALRRLADLAAANMPFRSLIGMGYHDTVTPPVIRRNLVENPAWYTAYTPYQPEISQGRLEALLGFQTVVSDLTGMDLANASLLDEATAAAEAMTLLQRVSKSDRHVFMVDPAAHPQTIEVITGRAEPLGIDVLLARPDPGVPEDCFGVLIQYPDTYGSIADLAPMIEATHAAGAGVAVAADLLALCLLAAPGDLGADVVVGTSQRFGVPLGFGGPHAGYMATREAYRRSLPGRLVGVSRDEAGRPGLRLALQTREQHIRRERATSNICTAQVLLAVVAAMYAAYHGPDGLKSIASRIHMLTVRLAEGLRDSGFNVPTSAFFDTITVTVDDADPLLEKAVSVGINLRPIDTQTIGISLDETCDESTIDQVLGVFGAAAASDDDVSSVIPDRFRRNSEFLTSPMFHQYRSETEMLRYLRRLSDRDIALDRSMIPLGSCTMKLNSAAEMEPISWPGFAAIHPFAPSSQTVGYRELIADLEQMLIEITGYDAVSLQPNAGSQGELAGLLAIRAFHRSRGDIGRTICLIPSSAHGTNAASAVMAGMSVVVVECDDRGDIDTADLAAKLEEHSADLAALMVTYPSTHGVFEEQIVEICDAVHAAGGQVYLDGANLNAMVGIAQPGKFGADVSHLNLHKTFCIPHGGGGPGVGPIGVRSHLASFLPGHSVVPGVGGSNAVPAVAAAPWGSAGILPIAWGYVAMMGPDLKRATEVAILSANYIAKRLDPYFPVLYTGRGGTVAHECIIDLRPAQKTSGITVDDVAKRLIDYGFHAPTMSFPVAGTLMVEPTESESLAELDRFCDAMIAIRGEIDRVESGDFHPTDNPLVRAPHTVDDVVDDNWDRAYTRTEAAFPLDHLKADKYWPPVGRIDGAFGDKNLACDCPSLDAYR